MQEWKDMVMQEVGRELQVIRQVQEGAMEVQRQGFQRELERVREIFESKSAASENEIRLLKALRQHPAQKMSPAKRDSTTSRTDKTKEKGVNRKNEKELRSSILWRRIK